MNVDITRLEASVNYVAIAKEMGLNLNDEQCECAMDNEFSPCFWPEGDTGLILVEAVDASDIEDKVKEALKTYAEQKED